MSNELFLKTVKKETGAEDYPFMMKKGYAMNQISYFLRKHGSLFVLSLPGILFLLIFNYYPMYGIVLPFKNFIPSRGFFKSEWVGFENFKFLFNTSDSWIVTRNLLVQNLLFIVSGLVVSVFLALVLFELSNRKVKVFQTFFFLPYFVSWVVASYLLLSFLDMDNGVVNSILKVFGVEPVLWYNEAKYWLPILVLVYLWKNTGYSVLIYYSALVSQSKELFEAAEIDGANKIQIIRMIKLPLLKPLIILMTMLSLGRIFFGNFDMIYNVTLNSPFLYGTVDIIDTYVYRALIVSGDIGMASAAGIYQSVVGFIVVLTANMLLRKFQPENKLF